MCDSFIAWLWANSHWSCFDSETLNDIREAPSCPLLRKHMSWGPYLIHDKLHLPGLVRAQHKTAVRVKRTNGQKETEIHSVHLGTNISSSFKIPRLTIFYSKVDSNYCLFPQADWMCNFLHLLRSWQFDNRRAATAVLATEVWGSVCFFFCQSSLSWHTLSSLCPATLLRCFLLLHSALSSTHFLLFFIRF